MRRQGTDNIVVVGARQHNLKIDRLTLPKNQLIVFTGVSGSGKSSLAFDTLYAEGQRRYVESLSAYARQFLGQLDKPSYDHIRGLSPTIAIEQKAALSNPRSTVGTITEIHDYLRVLYARVGIQHCPSCGMVVHALSPSEIVQKLAHSTQEQLLLAPLVAQRKGEQRELFQGLRVRGYVRVRVDGSVERLESLEGLDKRKKHDVELVVDRLVPSRTSVERLTDSVQVALREGHGMLWALATRGGNVLRLGTERACVQCNRAFAELTPGHFSFNSPLGMCPGCNGLGRHEAIDPSLLVPDENLSIRQGALVPFSGVMARGSGINFGMFEALGREFGVDLDRPWKALPKKQTELVLYGTGDKRVQVSWVGSHGRVSWPMQFEGVVRSLTRRYRETKSEDMRRYYARFMVDAPCPDCSGMRLGETARHVRIEDRSITEVCAWSVDAALEHFRGLKLCGAAARVSAEINKEVIHRLEFLQAVGLGYLSLDRAGASLSGGEAQRIRLAAQLGSELSGVLYVLDEPTIGLHPEDTSRLVDTLRRLRDAGNTVIVVEHERGTIEAADHVVDFGPGAGDRGGRVVYQGSTSGLTRSSTLTGRYLSGRARVTEPRSPRKASSWLTLRGAAENNLKNLDVRIPLGLFVAVTGVSGAGKSTLVSDILHPLLARHLHGSQKRVGAHAGLDGIEHLDKVVLIDQAPIGRTPRSNPATYTKAFDDIREIFSQTPEARAAGFSAGRFSFNVAGGRCEACAGDGVRRVEMHFLPDVYVTCEVCHGHRYEPSTLGVRYRGLNIAQVLDTSVDQACQHFSAHPRLLAVLRTLTDVGLGYLKLGQPAPTLSGGEAQRVKLSRELARRDTGRTLYVLDEPTTGLHFDDVAKLLIVLGRLVDAGNSVVVIEHDLDVMLAADHLIDLGPGGGEAGGELVCQGSPEQVARCKRSKTGRALQRRLSAASTHCRAH